MSRGTGNADPAYVADALIGATELTRSTPAQIHSAITCGSVDDGKST